MVVLSFGKVSRNSLKIFGKVSKKSVYGEGVEKTVIKNCI